MRHYETKTVTEQRTTLVSQTCDLCGAKADQPDHRWFGDWYDVNETKISVTVGMKTGESFPEGGRGTEYEIDICPQCFKDKLIPWLRSQGAKVEEKGWDW